MMVAALVAKGIIGIGVPRSKGRASVQMGLQVRLNQGKNLLGGIARFKIVPDTDGKLRWIDWELNRSLPDFSVVGQI